MLPDILEDRLDIVFVGTAAGLVSARAGIYYANAQNKFWPTLEAIGLIPKGFDRAEFARLPQFGIGLTDLCKTRAGMDHTLAREDFDVAGLADKLRRFRPGAVAFTSKKGASVFLQCRSATLDLGVPLPSTRIFRRCLRCHRPRARPAGIGTSRPGKDWHAG